MQKVYAHENRLIVFDIRNLLEDAGIDCHIRNEFSGGGVGDLSPFETWPEIWVADDQAKAALDLLAQREQQAASLPPWQCKTCGERNDGHFQVCWNCCSEQVVACSAELEQLL